MSHVVSSTLRWEFGFYQARATAWMGNRSGIAKSKVYILSKVVFSGYHNFHNESPAATQQGIHKARKSSFANSLERG
jgi:hypothetical protein